jgi:hypothetical protein
LARTIAILVHPTRIQRWPDLLIRSGVGFQGFKPTLHHAAAQLYITPFVTTDGARKLPTSAVRIGTYGCDTNVIAVIQARPTQQKPSAKSLEAARRSFPSSCPPHPGSSGWLGPYALVHLSLSQGHSPRPRRFRIANISPKNPNPINMRP